MQTRLFASLCALIVCAVFWWSSEGRHLRWNGYETRNAVLVFALLAAVTVVTPWLDKNLRAKVLLVGSILMGAVLARWLVLVALAFAWLTLRVVRSTWRPSLKLLLLLGTWTALALGKWWIHAWFPGLELARLTFYWALLPAALIYLVVEHARGRLQHAKPIDEWLYLLALPRFLLPFAQPISPRNFIDSGRAPLTKALSLRALGLGLYGAACQFGADHFRYTIWPKDPRVTLSEHVINVLETGGFIYCFNSARIFCAIAVLRLLGFDLGSGFRWPLFSRSFADIYRRWNYYLFEFASSIVYWPLVSRLRRFMPVRLAYVLAGYPAIFFGVWAISNVVFPLGVGLTPKPLIRHLADGQLLLAYAAVWSLILLPHAAAGSLRRFRRNRWWKWGSYATAGALAASVATLAYAYRVYLY